MDNIINSLDAFLGDYHGYRGNHHHRPLYLPVVDLGAEHAYMDAVPWTAGRDCILYISSTVSDEYHLMVGREASQCGIDYGHCRVPARAS